MDLKTLNLEFQKLPDIQLPCFITFVGLIFGIIVSESISQMQYRFYYYLPKWSIFLSLSLLIFIPRKIVLFIISILLGIVVSLPHINERLKNNDIINKVAENECVIKGTICTFLKSPYPNNAFLLKNIHIVFKNSTYSLPSESVRFSINGNFDYYDCLTLSGNLEVDTIFNKIFLTLKNAQLLKKETDSSLFIGLSQVVRHKILSAINQTDNYSSRAILKSLLTGDRSNLSKVQKRVFKESGLYHLLALSGLHVIIIITYLFLILKFLPLYQNHKNIIVIISLWLFYFSAGAATTLFRATFAATIYLLAPLLQRRGNSKNSLGAAGIIWLIFHPLDIYSPSFQLSFTASLVIIEFIPVLNRYTNKIENRILKFLQSFILNPTILTVLILIFTMPILANHFGTLSFGALVLNIPALILVDISIYLFLTGTLILNTIIGKFLITCSSFFIEILYSIIKLAVYNEKVYFDFPNISNRYTILLLFTLLIFKLFPKRNYLLKFCLPITLLTFLLLIS